MAVFSDVGNGENTKILCSGLIGGYTDAFIMPHLYFSLPLLF
jgi:hypothetical protein